MELGMEIQMDGQLIDDIEACALERGVTVPELIIRAVQDDLAR